MLHVPQLPLFHSVTPCHKIRQRGGSRNFRDVKYWHWITSNFRQIASWNLSRFSEFCSFPICLNEITWQKEPDIFRHMGVANKNWPLTWEPRNIEGPKEYMPIVHGLMHGVPVLKIVKSTAANTWASVWTLQVQIFIFCWPCILMFSIPKCYNI